ncbi:hypothetical protein IAT40_006848 [Kwoniella sp. CBS 6097]
MYSSTYSPSPSSPYTSPPAPPHDPYRSSPISVASKQPYNAAFSPPPQMPAAAYPSIPIAAAGPGQSQPRGYPQQQSYPSTQQYARGATQGSQSSRYASPVIQPVPYGNGYPQQQQQPQPQQLPPPQKHKGTLAPGQIVRVGEVAVRIERYLSEGGYAHVYLTTSEKPVYPPSKSGEKKGRWGEKGYTEHCLKRIAFEDDAVWVDVKKEIEVMKSLPPNPHLIQYLGSTHSRLPSGGHEVFILMEFCAGGGIIDLLNKRLRDRLKEIEILNIFTDVCEAVAAMHHLSQPLLHRDLKIENVLSQPISTPPTPSRPSPLIFKLCDFGSTTFPADKPPSSKIEADALAMDLNKHTTLQYRSPEMVEPMLGLPVGLPSDVWALGCLLYKLCYYTTPFEEHGPLAIVNAKYTFPPVPVYSPRLQHLIASMLVEQPHRRPSVFEVLRTAHEMSGTKPEMDYPIPSRSLAAPAQSRQPSRSPQQSNNLLDFTGAASSVDKTPVLQPSLASTVQPQRRGRPTRESSQKQIDVPSASSPSAMPPMPVPPAQPQPISSSFQARTQTPKLQVTGEKALPKAPSPGLDAFGMPSIPTSSSNKSERGFGDSFAAPKPSAPTGASRFGANLPRPPSGFGDSFGVSRSASMSSRTSPKANPKRSPSTSQQAHKQASANSVSQARKSPLPSSSVPDGEVSFETRFPSIEALSGSDTFTPSIERENLISPPVTSPPVSRPQFGSKPSVMGNMTGGDLRSPTQPTAPVNRDQQPQPRSTHVTGTAFKGIQGGVRSPSPTAQKTDYFGHATTTRSQPQASPAVSTVSTIKTPLLEDLMGDEESNGLQVPSIQPGRSTTPMSATSATSRLLPSSPGAMSTSSRGPPSSPGSAGIPQATPTTGHHRPLLPNIDASKPTSNIMSDQWSPLERLRSQGTPAQASQQKQSDPGPTNVEVDSSDDEMGPEDAGGRGRRPTSPTTGDAAPSSPQKLSQRAMAFGGLPTREGSTKSSTVSIPVDSASTSGQGSQRGFPGSSGERSRPQSMFITPSSSSNKSFSNLLSPPITEEPSSSLPKPDQSRPSHGRKGSITDIVSRYEMMKPPSATSGFDPRKQSQNPVGSSPSTSAHAKPTTGSVGGSNELGRKPSIASKPQALRKPSVDEQKSAPPPTTSTSSNVSNEPSSIKPASPTSPVKPKMAASAKPGPGIIAPKPIRHGETPAAEGYSRSSSGRSFPITKPKPSLHTSSINEKDRDSGEGKSPAGSGSGKNSPEKQQPVNLLIQRWNQGQTANANANKVVPKRGGYI